MALPSWLREVNGTYGSNQTPCTVYAYDMYNGSHWYVVEGAQVVNCTYDDIEDGVDVEELRDVDCFTANEPIESCEHLEEEVDEL